jgi:16S rRNA (cytosine967-C5)-methyltransferase
MKLSTLIKHSAELFRIIRKSPSPADDLASNYLRSKKYIGGSERKIISELTFNALRTLSVAELCVSECLSVGLIKELELEQAFIYSAALFALHLEDSPIAKLSIPAAKINKNFIDLANEFKEAEIDFDFYDNKEIYPTVKALSLRIIDDLNGDNVHSSNILCMSPYFADSLRTIYERKALNSLAKSLMYSANVCLRVNELQIDRSSVLRDLENAGIEAKASEISPCGIILTGRPQLNDFPLYKNGAVEVQDIGSQIISYALGADQDSSILDACAGAGGKTLHLAAITRDKARIVATDTEFNRLKEIRNRSFRAGVKSIETIVQRKMELKSKIKDKFDYILIDAPCSGSGTVRRMPMPKWRINEKLINKLNKTQSEILDYYSAMLSPGGSLIYATCSLLPQENGLQAERFLHAHPEFKPEPIAPALKAAGVKLPDIDGSAYSAYLTPLNGETDGFFFAKFKLDEDYEDR